MIDRKSGQSTDRNPDGAFLAENSGKPRGTRHKVTRAVADLLDGQAEAISQKAVDMPLKVTPRNVLGGVHFCGFYDIGPQCAGRATDKPMPLPTITKGYSRDRKQRANNVYRQVW